MYFSLRFSNWSRQSNTMPLAFYPYIACSSLLKLRLIAVSLLDYLCLDLCPCTTARARCCDTAHLQKYSMSQEKSHASNLIGSSGSWTVESARPCTMLCRLLDSLPDRSNWGLTNQRREELHCHTNTHLSLVSSKLNVCDHCLATYKARYQGMARSVSLSMRPARVWWRNALCAIIMSTLY